MKRPVVSFEMSMGFFFVTLGNLYIEAQGYVSALLENLRGMCCSGTC